MTVVGSGTLAYFGVFLVVPFTAIVLALALLVLALGSLVALVGLGQSAWWKVALVPLAVSLGALVRPLRRLWLRVRMPQVLSFDSAASVEAATAVGPKAHGVALAWSLGLPVAEGFVVTSTARLGSRAFRWRLARLLRTLPGETVIVRSSFLGEDCVEGSGAGRFLTERDLPRDVDVVLAAIDRVRSSANAAADVAHRRGAVLVQRFLRCRAAGVAASVDPRTGFTERALVQVTDLAADATTTWVLDRLARVPPGAPNALSTVDRLAARHSGPIECELAWPASTQDAPVVLQCRPLLAVPRVTTWVNGGAVSLPAVPLSPASRAVYVGPRGLAARLRDALEPIGLRGPDDADVREHLDRFYLRYRTRVEVTSPVRLGRFVLGWAPRPVDGHARAARALARLGFWRNAVEALHGGTLPAAWSVALEAGLEPPGRPGTPEELLDPGYDVAWPPWRPPQRPQLPVDAVQTGLVSRWALHFALRRYHAALVERAEAKEALLQQQRRLRGSLPTADPEAITTWRDQCATSAPSVLHLLPSGLPVTDPEPARWSPAVAGLAVAPLARAPVPDDLAGPVVLVVPDARSLWARHFASCAGLVVERGGPLSHLVLLAREAGLPTVIGAAPVWLDGTLVRLNGGTGVLEREPPSL